MNMISKINRHGKDVITTESHFLFWKSVRVFEAQKESPPGYWKWLELPDYNLVNDGLSIQLDAWNNYNKSFKRRAKDAAA